MVLDKVHVIMTVDGSSELKQAAVIPIGRLDFDAPDDTFVIFKYAEGAFPSAGFSNTLKFVVKEKDASSGEVDEQGIEDEYFVSHRM